MDHLPEPMAFQNAAYDDENLCTACSAASNAGLPTYESAMAESPAYVNSNTSGENFELKRMNNYGTDNLPGSNLQSASSQARGSRLITSNI